MPQLDAKDGTLHSVHAVVESLQRVFVAALLTPAPQQPHRPGEPRVARYGRTAFAVGPEVLARIKAEPGGLADRSAGSPLVAGAMRLRRVFDDPQPMPHRDRDNRIHVCRVT